jgi:hypothetical protein
MNKKIIEPGSQALIPAWKEKFAQLVAGGATAGGAYRQIKPKVARSTSETEGPALLREPQTQLRVAYLQCKAGERVTQNAIADLAECKQFLTRVLRAKLTELPDDSDLWQELELTEDKVKKKLPGKIDAVKVLIATTSDAPTERIAVTTTGAAAEMVRQMLKEGGDE